MKKWLLVPWVALAPMLIGCDKSESENGADPAVEVGERGQMLVGVSSEADDVNGFWIRVYSSDWSELVTEQYAPLETEPLPAHLMPGGAEGHSFGDAYFVVPAGAYNVRILPMVDQANHSRVCADAEDEGVVVMPGLTTEIVLISQCGGPDNGGLDVIATTNHEPNIQDLDFIPSKFTHPFKYGFLKSLHCFFLI